VDSAGLQEGTRVRTEVLGPDFVQEANARLTDFKRIFGNFATEYSWGGAWAREGLDRRSRSLVTLGALVALRCESEIGTHVRAGLRNGLTAAEIAEALLQAAVYAGVPAGIIAFDVADKVLASLGEPATDAEGRPTDDTASLAERRGSRPT
jgi:4-carboxymuconolactone decarboxylase